MSSSKKLDLSRYKRSNEGMMEFVLLMEQSDSALRNKILGEVEKEDPDFAWEAMKRVVFFEEIIYLDESVLTEIVNAISPKVLAYALYQMPETFRNTLLGAMNFREKRLIQDEEEKMGNKMAEGLITGARKQVLKTCRTLEAKGKILFQLETCPRFEAAKKRSA